MKCSLFLVGHENFTPNAGKTCNNGTESESNRNDKAKDPEHNTGPNPLIIKNEAAEPVDKG